MAADGEDVYCTLVMNDAYLPGAAVLAHSLRDAGSQKKLACLVVPDGLRQSTIDELRSLYNYVIPIERIGTPNPANLYLMNRPDLLYTFTKINLWKQTQFRKIVYIDADVVALRAPDELFDIQEPFAAAPDVGWPDAFNSGVMVLSPDMGEYQALRGLAGAGDSFDGADQGLLNQYFEHRPWKRLRFTYNTTPSANYQYEPAYRYFKRDISLVHFIGSEKPWQRGRSAQGTPNAFQEMLSRWWAVYDRHFHVSTTDYIHGQRNVVHHYVKEDVQSHSSQTEALSAAGYPAATTAPAPPPQSIEHPKTAEHAHIHVAPAAPIVEHRQFSAPHMEWDATRGAPPIESKPEAANFPSQIYEFNTDPQPFRPPPSYPEPPKDMWYSVPTSKKVEKLKPLFPWEERDVGKPTRRFAEDDPVPPPPALEPEYEPYADELEVSSDKVEPVTPTIQVTDEAGWSGFASNKNAWDDVNGINNYVRALTSFQRNRGQVQVIQENVPSSTHQSQQQQQQQQHISDAANEPEPVDLIEKVRNRRESLKLTDFPTAFERPSLPVTPAPRRRPTFWGEERDSEGDLPGAEGVPTQAEWDPNTQLDALRRNSLLSLSSAAEMEGRRFSTREMVMSARPIPEEVLQHPHVPIAKIDGAADERHVALSGSASPHGLVDLAAKGAIDGLFSSHSETATSREETNLNTAINSSSSTLTAADKHLASESASGEAHTISAADVAADELDMSSSRISEFASNFQESSSSKERSSGFDSSASLEQEFQVPGSFLSSSGSRESTFTSSETRDEQSFQSSSTWSAEEEDVDQQVSEGRDF